MNNRVIKYRGKRIYNHEWVYGSVLIDDLHNRSFIVHADFYLADKTIVSIGREEVVFDSVGQYTGLKDKNRVEIYEGDVVHVQYNYFGNKVVAWVENGGYWNIGRFNLSKSKVIGNIYSSPNLINTAKE